MLPRSQNSMKVCDGTTAWGLMCHAGPAPDGPALVSRLTPQAAAGSMPPRAVATPSGVPATQPQPRSPSVTPQPRSCACVSLIALQRPRSRSLLRCCGARREREQPRHSSRKWLPSATKESSRSAIWSMSSGCTTGVAAFVWRAVGDDASTIRARMLGQLHCMLNSLMSRSSG